jgi:hypothetical protein
MTAAEITAQSPPTFLVNGDTLKAKAKAALAANSTFLALTAPTNAQVLAQVKSLTRQTNALIRLQLAELDDVTDA